MIPESYKENDGCHNCLHIFRYFEYDEDTILYCINDGVKRPPCGSVCMRECFSDIVKKYLDYGDPLFEIHFSELMDAWNKWTENREVNPYGICVSHLKEVK